MLHMRQTQGGDAHVRHDLHVLVDLGVRDDGSLAEAGRHLDVGSVEGVGLAVQQELALVAETHGADAQRNLGAVDRLTVQQDFRHRPVEVRRSPSFPQSRVGQRQGLLHRLPPAGRQGRRRTGLGNNGAVRIDDARQHLEPPRRAAVVTH
ncbi:hypothetical protein D3C73_1305550 [compost metagenome]